MKTKLLIWLLPAILIALSGDQAFACSVNPVAVLTLTPHVHDLYLNRWYSPVGEVFFSGQASWDPDGGDPEIKLFEWNFGDGSSYSESPAAHADGEFDGITSHIYTVPGIYTISFKVTDNDADEGSPPDKWNTTTCTIAVVSVNLVVEGVPDNMEVTPGAFISYNNDDDNDEGTADNDETGTVTGEDNLIKITLLVSPALGNSDGKVRLSVPYGQKDLRIWQNPDKGNLVLQADNEVYYKDWLPPAVPQNLYVEGYLLSGTSTLYLSHMKDALTIHHDTVNFRCVQLQVSSDASAPLDDWPKTATQIRSPKYIFGKEDPIYVQATNLGIDPGLAETKNNLVKVTSESGGVARLTLKETDLASLYFNNVAAPGQLLYLSDADSGAGAAKIKVVDEEKLTFWLEIQPGSENYVSCYRVMVDRGEVAAVDGTPTLDAAEFHDDMVASYNWFSDGLYDKNHDRVLGDDEKCVELGNKVDFMYISGHCTSSDYPGTRIYAVDNSYGLKDHGSTNNLQTADVGTWARELDWLVLAACSTCKIDFDTMDGPGTEWIGTMNGGGMTHGIMGYRYGAPGGSTPTTDVALADEFVSALDDKSIKDAWIDTNFGHQWATADGIYSPLHAVAIFRNTNVSDRIQPFSSQWVTRDSDEANFTYYEIYWEYKEDHPHVVLDSVRTDYWPYIPP